MTQPGDEFELKITDVAYGGDGVSTLPDGMRVFIPFTALDDKVRAEIIEVQKSFARAEVCEILSPGEGRCEPRCPVYGRCGGCCYQHLSTPMEVQIKRRQLAAQLKRLGGVSAVPEIEVPTVAIPDWNYRNKITLHHDQQTGEWGYLGRDRHSLVAIDHCPIAMDPINEVIDELPEEESKATLRCDAEGQAHLVAAVPVTIREELLGHSVGVPLSGFYQVNPPVLEAMIIWLRDRFDQIAVNGFVDAYCGVGVMALGLAEQFQLGIGIEGNRQAVKRARENADAWGVEHLEFHKGQVARHLPKYLYHLDDVAPSCVLLDPPRGGISKEVAGQLRKHRPDWLVYVSCDAATLARDVKRLQAHDGYSLERVAMFNMFPQTAHFESIVILQRKDGKPE